MGRFSILLILLITVVACQAPDSSKREFGKEEIKAVIFNPSNWSAWPFHESLSGFSSDGQTIFVTRSDSNYQGKIFYSELEGNIWQDLNLLPFSRGFSDVGGSLSPEGNQLLFTSNRDATLIGFSDQWNIWTSKKKNNVWRAPWPLLAPINSTAFECCVSQVKEGVIYFSSNREGVWEIYRGGKEATGHWAIQKLSSTINHCKQGQWPSYVDQKENFLLFSAICEDGLGGDDIYISFKDNKGEWSNPVNLGMPVNTKGYEDSAILSLDGKELYFSSRGKDRGHPFSKIYKIPFDLKKYQNRE